MNEMRCMFVRMRQISISLWLRTFTRRKWRLIEKKKKLCTNKFLHVPAILRKRGHYTSTSGSILLVGPLVTYKPSDFYCKMFKRGALATSMGVTKPHMDDCTHFHPSSSSLVQKAATSHRVLWYLDIFLLVLSMKYQGIINDQYFLYLESEITSA